jgi:cytochrome c oxidase cbb3-type subunit 1
MLVLVIMPIIAASIIAIVKATALIKHFQQEHKAKKFAAYLKTLSPKEIEKLEQRKKELEFSLHNNELSGNLSASDKTGLIENINYEESIHFISEKRKAQQRPAVDPDLARLILWYIGAAIFWLVFGTTIGEYLGIKFSAPDIDHFSWLSFGRLRPVHTNAVFWGWATLAMLGLAYYVVPRVSNTNLFSIKKGYRSLIFINAAIVIGTISLMAGINNGGGEYREYTFPVMGLFGWGLWLSLRNFIKTIAQKTTKEIYISNWYIVSAIIFLLVIVFVAYFPYWQNGLGETIVQGYYMHQAVGMWFMLFNLGLLYYFLPQQLNKPIYSYSLGVLAFWTQILFYTLIGTHHFVFSAIPWWLQTVAIVGSVGMIIPVTAGTTNFLMTFKGSWGKVAGSYTLPFYLVGVIFYFTGSMQGTAEAFRFTNLVWHFTDFTVAHSHITMYGIITFMLWASIYAIVPRLTGKEPSKTLVGAHFWMALIGLLFYAIPLMIGATMKGLLWMDGKPFIEGIELMAPYWLWRAIGGTLMWISHLIFAYNFYTMIKATKQIHIPATAPEILDSIQGKDDFIKTHSA